MTANEDIIELARSIKLLVLDCDGVLTDGALHYFASPAHAAATDISIGLSFYAQDGHAIRMLMGSGVKVAVISGRGSLAFDYRMRELGIDHALSHVSDKGAALEGLLTELGLEPHTVAAVGDDLADLALFAIAGLSVAPADAHPVVRSQATHVTESMGGRGAVRDVAMLIMHAQGALDEPLGVYPNSTVP